MKQISARIVLSYFAFVLVAGVNAQDANNGRNLYNLPASPGAPSCSTGQCHGPTPAIGQNKIKLGTTASDIEYAIATVYKMTFLAGRYTRSQLDDLAAYIANPDEADRVRGATVNPPRADFGAVALADATGASYAVSFRNAGFEPLRLSSVKVSGDAFELNGGTCTPGRTLAPKEACKSLLLFRPKTAGENRGEIGFEYDTDAVLLTAPLIGVGSGAVAPNQRTVVEYRHPQLDYFFQTSRLNEQSLLDGIESFERTGEQFAVFSTQADGLLPISRFFFGQSAQNGRRGTHFYTLLLNEVELLRALNPTNQPLPGLPVGEGIDGYALAPTREGAGGICPAGTHPIYRLFRGNQRFPDDPNHRFTRDQRIYDDFVAKGWDGEGVKLCTPTRPG